jgi:uncharacterized repeat protein (TIGR04076 family)
MNSIDSASDDGFELYDLRVRVQAITGHCSCGHAVGDWFALRGGQLSLPPDQSFCVYALQSALLLLPAMQRPLQPNDWMANDHLVHCPDPACGTILSIERVGTRTFRRSDVSAPDDSAPDAGQRPMPSP